MSSPRPDTRYLASDPITTDTGQRLTNLTAGSGQTGHESPSTRTALDGTGVGRAVEVLFDFETDVDAGHLLSYGDTNKFNYLGLYGLFVEGNELGAYADGTFYAFVPLSTGTIFVAWSTEPNPLTTGTGDALRSTLAVYGPGSAMNIRSFTHSIVTAASTVFAIGDTFTGATPAGFPYTGPIDGVRISARYHSPAESREHWVAATTEPAAQGITAVEGPVLPASAALAGALAGPQYQAAAAALAVGRGARHRLVGPAVLLLALAPIVWDPGLTSALTRAIILAGGYRSQLGWLWRRRIPPQAEWVRVSVQLATWHPDAGAVSVSVRLYSSGARPPGAQPSETSMVTATRTTDDGVGGVGVVLVFAALLRVRRDDAGRSHFWLAVNAAAGNAFTIRSINLQPVSKPAADVDPPDQWGP